MRVLFESIGRDLRHGARAMARNVGFSLAVVLTLSLGIGGTTSVFSVVNAVLLRPLPYREPDRLAVLWTVNLKQNMPDGSSYPNFEDWKAQSTTFEDMALLHRMVEATLTGRGEAERIKVGRVSANFFDLLGVRPALGRTFTAQEEVAEVRVAVLSDSLWRSRFGASEDVLGADLELDGKRSRIIGIMPAGFSFLDERFQLWEPHTVFEPFGLPWARLKGHRPLDVYRVVGRLKAGVDVDQAQQEMTAIAAGLSRQYPESNADLGVSVSPLHSEMAGPSLPAALWTLLGAVILVLLVVCANVANLLLARGLARRGEFALREALGAGRKRIVRQLLTEAALVSGMAGIAGLVLALLGVRLLIGYAPGDIPRLQEAGLDTRLLLFTAGVCALAGLVVGVVPAFRISRETSILVRSGGRATSGGRSRRHAGGLLVVCEFALALVLLLGAGLMMRSFLAAQATPPGYDIRSMLVMKLDAPRSGYPQGTDVDAFYEQALQRLASLSGVEAVGAIEDFFFRRFPDARITVEGQPPPVSSQTAPRLIRTSVSPGFFQALRIPLLGGRQFSKQDGPAAQPVAIINQTMAKRFWSGQDPIGKRFKSGGPNSTSPWTTVVGLVGDARRQGLDREPIAQAFTPMAQSPSRSMTIMARCSSPAEDLADAARWEVRSLDPAVPVFEISTLKGLLGESLSRRRFHTELLGLFSFLAVLVAMIGVYAIMRCDVSSRRREIGIRLTLGSSRRRILGSVIREGMGLCLAGVVVGTASGLALTRLLSSFLYQVSPADPMTFFLAPAFLAAVGLAGCFLPAWRATRVDPAVSLREEA